MFFPFSVSLHTAHGWTHSIPWCCNAFWRALLGNFVMLEIAHLRDSTKPSPRDAETDLADCAPGRGNFAVTLADNWMKQITYFHEKLSRVLLACYPAPHSQQTGHREWGQGFVESQNRMARRQHKSAALSWVLPGNRILPDAGLRLCFRKRCQQSVLTSASMSFKYYKHRFLGNHICPGWFYLASAPSHHILLFLISTAREAKRDPADILLSVLHSREPCSFHHQLLLPVLYFHAAWAELYQDIQSWF